MLSRMGWFSRALRPKPARVAAGAARPPRQGAGGDSTDVLSPFVSSNDLLGSVDASLIAELFGDHAAENLPLSRDAAMSVPAIARARNVLCTTAGRLPLLTYRDRDLAPGRSPLDQPERVAFRPRFVTLLWTVDAMLFYGRAWWIVVERYAEDGRPRSFEWVPEWNARIVDGQLVGTLDGRHRTIAERDVVRIDGPHDGILNYGSATIRQAMRLDRAALRIAENPVPAIELHQTTPDELEDDEIDKLVDRWIKARRRTGVGYTNAAIETKTLGLNPEQLIIEGRKLAALECARMVNVPAWVVDAPVEGSSLTYSNVPSRSRELIDFALMPYLAAIESRLSLDDVLAAGWWCRFDVDELLRGDFKDRMDGYKVAVESGVYKAEELRQREEGRPAERLDDENGDTQ